MKSKTKKKIKKKKQKSQQSLKKIWLCISL